MIASRLRQVAQWRPRFSLRGLLLLFVAASIGLGIYRYWRIEHTPIEWQEFNVEKLQKGTDRGNIAFVFIGAAWCQPFTHYEETVLEQPRMRRLIHDERIIPFLLNSDNNLAACRALGITHIPQLAIFLPGERMPSRLIEKMPAEGELIDELNRALHDAQEIQRSQKPVTQP